jgi:hypothetical protein
MLVVRVSCLPELNQGQLSGLCADIINAARDIEGLEISGEGDILVLFPKDMMALGLGEEIFIEIIAPDGRDQINIPFTLFGNSLADALTDVMKRRFPNARVWGTMQKTRNEDGSVHCFSITK